MSDGSLYPRVMGEAFQRLAPTIRRFHTLAGSHELHGWVETDAPTAFVAKALAVCLGTPLETGDGPLCFELEASSGQETWTRRFPSKVMASTLSLRGGALVERLGMARLSFALSEVAGRLEMVLERLSVLGIPCPSWLLPEIVATEKEDGDKLLFRVEASYRFIGTVASYRGHLVVSETQPR